MKLIPLLTLTYIVFVLQATLAPALAVGSSTPHFVLLALVPVVMHLGGRQGLLCAAAWGLLSDCLTAGRLGPDLIAFSLLAWLLQIVRRRSTLTSPLLVALLGTVAMSGNLAGATALRCWQAGQAFDHSLFVSAALTAAYSGLVLLGVLLLWRMVNWFVPAGQAAQSATVANRWRMLTE